MCIQQQQANGPSYRANLDPIKVAAIWSLQKNVYITSLKFNSIQGQEEILGFCPTVAKMNLLCSGRVLCKHALCSYGGHAVPVYPQGTVQAYVLVVPIKYLNALTISPDQCMYAYINTRVKENEVANTAQPCMAQHGSLYGTDTKARENQSQ